MLIWQDPEPQYDKPPGRGSRIAFLLVLNFCAAAALFVAFFPRIAEKIWR